MIEAGIPHFIVALGIRQSVVGLTKVPFAGEEGFVASRLQHRSQRPFFRWEAAALTLEGNGRHPAAVRNAAGLHGSAARRAARLSVERKERHSLAGQTIDIRRRHSAPLTAAVGTEIPVADIIPYQQNDVWLLLLSNHRPDCGREGKKCNRAKP